jgi:DnaJ-class molecular chaperone
MPRKKKCPVCKGEGSVTAIVGTRKKGGPSAGQLTWCLNCNGEGKV